MRKKKRKKKKTREKERERDRERARERTEEGEKARAKERERERAEKERERANRERGATYNTLKSTYEERGGVYKSARKTKEKETGDGPQPEQQRRPGGLVPGVVVPGPGRPSDWFFWYPHRLFDIGEPKTCNCTKKTNLSQRGPPKTL